MSENAKVPFAAFGRFIGRSRYVVLIVVVAVLLVSLSLFLLGTIDALQTIYKAWRGLFAAGDTGGTELVIEFLAVIGIMLRAVVFYLIGVGLYSLFIAPLNLTAALGVETLGDLESKVISVVVVILAVTFLQHFIRWEDSVAMMQNGLTMAAVIASLTLFQFIGQRAKEFAKQNAPDTTKRAQAEMFHKDREQRVVAPDEVDSSANGQPENEKV